MAIKYKISTKKPFSAPHYKRVYQLTASALLSIALYLTALYLAPLQKLRYTEEMMRAARMMDRAITIIRTFKNKQNIPIHEQLDTNGTGLIGTRRGRFSTSLGNLAAKRTTANPNMAALVVHLLQRAGVGEGDMVALGNSGSFPALMIASIVAVQSLKAHPLPIISIGASSFGATDKDFNLLEIYILLYRQGIFSCQPLAVSMGGEGDVGREFGSKTRQDLQNRLDSMSIPIIFYQDLQHNINQRLALYKSAARDNKISLFINSGGNEANLGQNAAILKVKPGLNLGLAAPQTKKRGVIFDMAAQGIPTIHLLFIKGLARTYGLPWDPSPLPKPGESKLKDPEASPPAAFWLITILYFSGLGLIVFWRQREKG